jgi:hypothetical protein
LGLRVGLGLQDASIDVKIVLGVSFRWVSWCGWYAWAVVWGSWRR